MRAWLDARAAEETSLATLVADIAQGASQRAGRDGTKVELTTESVSPEVRFDGPLSRRVVDAVGASPLDVPTLPTQAGHDAGVLAAHVPAAMLFVRNPTGVSHSPAEHADLADCLAGVAALSRAVEGLLARDDVQ